MARTIIKGRKKGGGGGGTEAPDSLRSIQTARLVDLLSEGPVKGLVNGLKSVYLDGVPVVNPDGTSNFTGVTFGFLDGSPGQAGLPGFDAVESERAVGTEVRNGTPVTQTIVNTSVDQVRVTISVPQLTTLNTSSGDMTGGSFQYAIEVQSSGGGFVRLYTDTITGKTTSTYKKAVRLKLPGNGPWDVRVVRLSPNSTSSAVTNKCFWDSMTEIQSVKQRFTNSAVAGLQVNSELFGRVPTRAYDLLGQVVRVPVNYDPIAGTYAGVWNGTFKLAWTNNPAWIFYDLATHPRYGLGRFIKDAHLDKWRLYEIGRYCDERVPDGQGGTEPRFTCNMYLQTAVQARQALQDLASLMRAITFWGSSQIGIVQDAPADATMLFTRANVSGDFSYQGASRKTRHSAWTVYFNDLSQLGRRVPVVHVDPDLVKTMGVVMDTVSPIGCTSRGQALRLGRWMAYTEANGRTVSFRAGAEAAALGPGSVFKVADPAKAGKRLGGRVSAATTLAVTLDADVEIAAGETYQLEVMFPDPTAKLGYRTEKRAVSTAPGTVRTLQVAPSFSAAPAAGSIWVLQPSSIEPTWWRVVARKEAEGGHAFDIIGVAHDPDKFAAIEQGLKLPPRRTSGLNAKAPQVTALNVTEVPYLDVDSTRIKAVVSWVSPAAGLTFQVERRLNLGEWVKLPQTSSNSVEIDGLNPGSLDLRVTTINSLGIPSVPFEQTTTLVGWVARPDGVADFEAETVLAGIAMSWSPSLASNYRDTVILAGPVEEEAVEIFRGAATRFTWHPPADGTYKLWARHFNTSDKSSLAPATLDVDYVEISPIGLTLQASGQIFAVNAVGAASPATITFTAFDYKVLADLTWSIASGTAVLTGTGATRSLAFANMGSESVTVRVSEGTDFDEVTIVKLHDGVDGKSAINMLLSNEVHVLPADATGAVTSFAGASTTARVFLGATDDTISWTFSISASPGVSATLVTPGGVPTVSVTGMSTDVGYVDITATRSGFASPTARFSLAKSKAGPSGNKGDQGDAGSPGLQTAVAYLWQWSTGTPGNPTGSSYWTWASGSNASYGGGNGWQTAVPANPGTPGARLWVASKSVAATAGTSTSEVRWWEGGFSVAVYSQNGANGANGLRSATPAVYKWAPANPGVPIGGATFNWSSGGFGAAPSGWTLEPDAPTPGWTLYAARVALLDSTANATTGFNWGDSSVQPTGYAGTNGTGTAGAAGASARFAYAAISAGTSPGSGTRTSTGSGSAPAPGSWGLGETWSQSVPSYGANQLVIMTVGTYLPSTDTITWGDPMVATGRYGSLSAITTNTGDLTVTGRMTMTTGEIVAGNFTSASNWPSSGGGWSISPTVFRMGRYTGGSGQQFIEINSDGSIFAPSFSISGGIARFSGTLEAASGTFAGSLSAVTGSFANVTVGGLLYTPGKTNYDSGNGVMLGYYFGNSYLGVTSTASGSLKGMWINTGDGVLHITGGVISGGTIIDGTTITNPVLTLPPFTVSVSGGGTSYSSGSPYATVGFGAAVATPTGGNGPFSYRWTVNNLDIGTATLNTTVGNTVYIGAKTPYGYTTWSEINCTVTDANGRTCSGSVTVTHVNGTQY